MITDYFGLVGDASGVSTVKDLAILKIRIPAIDLLPSKRKMISVYKFTYM